MVFHSIEEKRAYERGKKIEQALSDGLNTMSYVEFVIAGILDAYERDHRSLQAEILRFGIKLFKRATMIGTDARNEHAVRVVKIAVSAIEKVIGEIRDPDPERRAKK